VKEQATNSPDQIKAKKRESARLLYLTLSAIFICSLVTCNLIFLKFFSWKPFAWLTLGADTDSIWFSLTQTVFITSVGLLPYPITFLATDLISELYGSKRANHVVIAGLVASVFALLIVILAESVPAYEGSPLSDALFNKVFGLAGASVFASMVAYLIAQFIDIQIFHFWKKYTDGNKLWLRNVFSTIPSQLVDSFLISTLLCSLGALPWSDYWVVFITGFVYKIMFAVLDTPFFYLATNWACRHFGIKRGKELLDI